MKKILLLLLISYYTFMGYSQSGLVKKELNNKGIVTFAEFQADSAKSMKESKQLLKQLHNLGKDEEFVLTGSKTDELGFLHQYFDQYYKGIRVAYSSYSVHSEADVVNTAIGTYNKTGDVDTNAKLSEKEALVYAVRFVGADVYKWEIPEEEQWLQENYNGSYYPEGELVIVNDRLKTNLQFRLAWKFDVYAHIPLSRNLIYVDAVTGDILDVESKLYHVNSVGTAATRYSGARSIVADSYSGGFRLRETRNNVRIETYNMNGKGTNYSGASDFTDNNNSWTVAEFNNTSMDNAALDAHWGAEMTYDYFKAVHGRNSWNGTGGPLLNYVHTNLIAFGLSNNINAFWDGQRLTYGDGGNCHDPLTSLDIVAHEIAHGINSTTAKMRYEGESGALNESLSDIWSACVEYWAASEKQTWLNGEDITLCEDAFRSMSNPNGHRQPDTYQSPLPSGKGFWVNTNGCIPTLYNDYCGVHINSGVPNFWFFLLVNGGVGSNDIGNNYSVSGIGIEKAAKIVYRAETVTLASNNEQFVTFNQFRNATISAASNLFGANSNEVIQVTNAWYAVGVGSQYQYPISGPDRICDQATYTINNLPAGATVHWSVSFNLSVSQGQGTATATLTNLSMNGSAIGSVQALVNINGTDLELTKMIRAANPPGSISAAFDPKIHAFVAEVSSGNSYIFYANDILESVPASNIRWEVTSPSGMTFLYGGYSPVIDFNSGGAHILRMRWSGSCGNSTYAVKNIVVLGPQITDPRLRIYPNPATDILAVEFTANEPANEIAALSRTASTTVETYTIQLWNEQQGLVRTKESTESQQQISLQGLPSGTYYVVLIKDGVTVGNQTLLKQ